MPDKDERIAINHPDKLKDWGHGFKNTDIEKILGGKLTNKGQWYVEYANIYKINPAVAAAISMQETGGKSDAIMNKNNVGGIRHKVNGTYVVKSYPSLEEGIRAHISNLSRNYMSQGRKSLNDIVNKYMSGESDSKKQQWVNAVNTFYKKTGKTYSTSLSGAGIKSETINPIPIDKEDEKYDINGRPGNNPSGGGTLGGTDPDQAIKKKLLTSAPMTKKDTANSWIVVHNTAGGSDTSAVYNTFQGGRASCHYAVGDDGILQMMEDTWAGIHCGSKGSQDASNYAKSAKAGDRGCSNANSIGIEICDSYNPSTGDMPQNKEESFIKRVKNTIELVRYLMKKYNIPIENVVGHVDVSGKPCPAFMIGSSFNGAKRQIFSWSEFKSTIESRNSTNEPIKIDADFGTTNNGGGGSSSGGPAPDFDQREDWTNLQDIKGVVLGFMYPHHMYSLNRYKDEWEKEGYDREFHYGVDSSGMRAYKENTLIAESMQDNNSSTYINRALFGNKAIKHCISVGIFTSKALTNYEVTEKRLIRDIARVLHKFGLQTKDLWREFDLNRAPSPLIYLDRSKWKLFLREIDKQLMHLEGKYPVFVNKRKGVTKKETVVYKTADTSSIKIITLKAGMEVVSTEDTDGDFEKISSPANGWILSENVEWKNEKLSLYPEVKKDEDKEEGNPQTPDFPQIDEASMPEVTNVLTHEEYLQLLTYGNPELVDNYAQMHEPYDKNLPEVEAGGMITDDERLAAMINQSRTRNENTIHYAIIEASAGDGDHCKRASSELSSITKPDAIKVEPIYPDLIIPPKYSTSDQNISDPNALPPGVFAGVGTIADYLEKSKETSENADMYKITMFDYNKVKQKEASKGKPVNYADPYPFDDKIHELERHYPKVKIDEIEARLYDCNHIGCPIGQPMAQNFHMLNDALITQSKKVEERLVRLENILSTMTRNIGRLGSRINVNCVYYGGQDTFGKYKTIRCLKDDRLEDGCSMTIDQCMSCNRYEPILGQVYEILDATGMNGAYISDDEQMSYNNAIDFNKLDNVSVQDYANLADNTNNEEYKSLVELWKEIDKEDFIADLKKKYTGEELDAKLEAIKEHEYLFKMDWEPSYLEVQEPDVKVYPTEGITAKYKVKPIGDAPSNDDGAATKSLTRNKDWENDDLGSDVNMDKESYDKLVEGDWVDTREEADTYEINKYSSKDFFFDGFGTNINAGTTGGGGSTMPGMSGSAVRNKIVEKAKEIVSMHVDQKKAGYTQASRTQKVGQEKFYTPRWASQPIWGFDCSSMVSYCWDYAGLTELVGHNTKSGNPIARKGEVWWIDEAGIQKALPGDIMYWFKSSETDIAKIPSGSSVHTGVYIGDGKMCHASNSNGHPGEIYECTVMSHHKWAKSDGRIGIFTRPLELVEADKNSGGSGEVEVVDGEITVNGKTYKTVGKIPGAVCTPYNAGDPAGGGTSYSISGQTVNGEKVPSESVGRHQKRWVASHNLPFGTKIVVPALAGKGIGSGEWTVVSTGGHLFDFDFNIPDGDKKTFGGKTTYDVYVTKWGDKTNKGELHMPWSYTDAIDYYAARNSLSKYASAWRAYVDMGGKLVKFHKFNAEDSQLNLNAKVDPRPGKE